jgi:hypothetical protein
MRKFTLIGAAVIGALASSAFAVIPWTTPAGSSPNNVFSYSGGQSTNGLFGDPIVTDSGFFFFPSGFLVTSSNGVAASASDKVRVQLTVPAGSNLALSLQEVGDYAILGGGASSVTGTVTATVLASTSTPIGTILADTFTNLHSTAGNLSGIWQGSASIAVPADVTKIQIVFDNILNATSSPNGTSTIDKKVSLIIVPEPATLGALLGGALFLLRRK